MSCLQNFSTKEILNNRRERCLSINGAQGAKYETGINLKIMINKYLYHLKFMLIHNIC